MRRTKRSGRLKAAGALLAAIMLSASAILPQSFVLAAEEDESSAMQEEAGGQDVDGVYRTKVINNVSIDDINIELAEYELDAFGNEIPYRNNKLVQPGQIVSKIARVTNVARPAWIRIKPEFFHDGGMEGVDESMMVLANDDWVKRGDYWYCTRWIPTGGTEDFIDQLKVPAWWDSSYANKNFGLTLTADAVQYENFTPDFSSDDPWFGTLIEQCVHTEYAKPTIHEVDGSFSIEFRGGAEGLVRLGDDWFEGWSKLMPGDLKDHDAVIKNNYNENVKIYFYTENITKDITGVDDRLLKNLHLTIYNGSDVIFSDTLDKEVEPILLGDFAPGEGTTMAWELYVPPELTNWSALTKTKTKWIWEARLPGKNYQTGDTFQPGIYRIAAVGCGLVIAISVTLLIIAAKKKKDKKREEGAR